MEPTDLAGEIVTIPEGLLRKLEHKFKDLCLNEEALGKIDEKFIQLNALLKIVVLNNSLKIDQLKKLSEFIKDLIQIANDSKDTYELRVGDWSTRPYINSISVSYLYVLDEIVEQLIDGRQDIKQEIPINNQLSQAASLLANTYSEIPEFNAVLHEINFYLKKILRGHICQRDLARMGQVTEKSVILANEFKSCSYQNTISKKWAIIKGLISTFEFLSGFVKITLEDVEYNSNQTERTECQNGLVNKPSGTLLNRPESVQAKVDLVFNHLEERWHNQGEVGLYRLMGLREEDIIHSLVKRKREEGKKNIYLLDVGAGRGAWGKAIERFLKSNGFLNCGIHFHIISVTGGDLLEKDSIITNDNVTLYSFNKFKIENIIAEFKNRDLEIENQADLIVIRSTLEHLADPLGTLSQLYKLLTNKDGILLGTGFIYYLSGYPERMSMSINWRVISSGSGLSLFRPFALQEAGGDFLLIRNSNSLNLPFEHECETYGQSARYRPIGLKLDYFMGNRKSTLFECGEHLFRGDDSGKAAMETLQRMGLVQSFRERGYGETGK